MMKFLRKNMRTVFIITVVGFLAGIFIGFGGYFFGGRSTGNAIAEINGVSIPFRKYTLLFNRTMDRLREDKTDITDDLMKQKRQEVIQDLIQEEVFSQEARKYGINVTDEEVAYDIQRWGAFQKDGKFDQRVYFQMLAYRLRMTPQEFEDSRRRQIAIAKLREFIASGVKITGREIEREYAYRHKGNMKSFLKDRDNFYNELYKEKVNDVLQEWYRILSSTVKIRVFTELLK